MMDYIKLGEILMVNTFLTASPDKDGFRKSAANLDKPRLWKQVTESWQLINLIENYHFLADYFGLPCPQNPYKIKEWTKIIMKKYKSLDYWIFLHQGKWVMFPKTKPKPTKLKYYDEYQILGRKILFNGKKYNKYELVLPGDKFITMGFGYHPVVIMWMLNIDSLKMYMNDHIKEFIKRGGEPGVSKLLQTYDESNAIHPIWCHDPEFINNHRAALLTKEIVRSEDPWYISKKEFQKAYQHYKDFPPDTKTVTTSSFEYYIWVFTQDIDNPRYLVRDDGSIHFRK